MTDTPAPAHPLTIPDTLDPIHAGILRACYFESAGELGFVIRGDAYDGLRVVYAVTDPAQTSIVYVGDSEQGRSLNARLKAHLDSRAKAGRVERTSLVFVHVLVTEYLVLDRFEQATGKWPVLNKAKTAKHTQNRKWKVNGVETYTVELLNPAPSPPGTKPPPKPRKPRGKAKRTTKYKITILD